MTAAASWLQTGGAGGVASSAARPASGWHPDICSDAWRVSHHEAAHAVVGIVLGVPILSATVIPCAGLNGKVSTGPTDPYSGLVMVMAGPAADRVTTRGWSEPMGWSDAENARDLIAQLPAGERAASRMGAMEMADRLVREHWRTIERVAAALRVRGRVEGYIIETFLK